MNLILNNKNEGLINQWIAVLLRIGSIERADLEYLNSHISDVVILMSKENLDAINGLFRTYNLSEVGMKPVEVGTEVADDDLPF